MHFRHRKPLLIAFSGIVIALTFIVIIGVFGLLRGPSTASQLEAPAHTARVSSASLGIDRPRPVLVTPQPESFARSVARALFSWDTRHEGGPSPWAQVLVDVADPDEGPAVASDIRGFLPVTQMWEQLAEYGTRQWLEVESVD